MKWDLAEMLVGVRLAGARSCVDRVKMVVGHQVRGCERSACSQAVAIQKVTRVALAALCRCLLETQHHKSKAE